MDMGKSGIKMSMFTPALHTVQVGTNTVEVRMGPIVKNGLSVLDWSHTSAV